MSGPLPKVCLASLPAPPPLGSIQFFDGYFSALFPGSHTITVTHTITGNSGAPQPFSVTQSFSVEAPEFSIDTTIVDTIYPPNGSSDQYGPKLPFLILTDPALPWERSLVPGAGMPNPASPVPWMALLIFAEGEIQLNAGSNDPVSSCTVQSLLAADPNVLKPDLTVSTDVANSQCQTITIPGAVFNAVVPTATDLTYLAHCRGVNTPDEGEVLLSVFLCNRLPVPNTLVTPAAPVRYYANLVSLEGFASYIGPNAQPIPNKQGQQTLQDVQMVSLYHWTFVSQPDEDQSFSALIDGLIASQQATPALNLPVSQSNLPANVQQRLQGGFAPLEFVSGSAEDTFAWYRGPFTATVPQPLPQVGNSAVPVSEADSADELMIYLAEQGLFDLSYAAAWNIGRSLALADSSFAQNVSAYRKAAASSVASIAQRSAMAHHFGTNDGEDLLGSHASRSRFANLVGRGLGRQWTGALSSVREAGAQPTAAFRPSRSAQMVRAVRMAASQPQAAAAASTDLQEIVDSVAAWLAKLSLLYPVPFSYLVPDSRMLPVESIRFFYVDPGWIQALTAGALSIAIQTSQDRAIHSTLLPQVMRATELHRRRAFARSRADALPVQSSGGVAMSGVLIRSQLVSGWPNLVVAATLGGAPLNIVRNDSSSPTVRLCLFDGIPDTVTVAQPYQGVLFGVEDAGIFPRCVTSPAFTGAQIANGTPTAPLFRTPPSGGLGGVLQVQATAAALEPAAGITPFASNAVVQWNGSPLQTTFVSPIQLQAAVPASLVATPATAQVTVVSNGATSLPAPFVIDAALEINSMNPTLVEAGGPGFTVVVSGVGFASTASIQWNGTALTSIVISANEITAVVAPTLVASAANITVTVFSNGVTSNAVTLSIVTSEPSIDAVAPNVAVAGGGGFALTVTGSGFSQTAQVNWNGSPLTTAFGSSQALKAAVAASLIASPGTVQITVTDGGSTSNAMPFTIATAAPTIGKISPSVALAGGNAVTLTVDGVNFTAGAVVQWSSTALNTTLQSPEQLVATAPATLVATAGNASITVLQAGVTSNAMPFTVLSPQPAIGLLEPPSIIAGSSDFTLIVTGGFGAGDFALQMVAAPELQSFPTG